MKTDKEKTKRNLIELSKEELKNILGGSWWEMRIINGKIVFIYHYN